MPTKDLLTWMRRDLYRFSGDEHIQIVEEDASFLKLKIYTDVNEYCVTAKADNTGGYLGATGKSRKPRAGETWQRGNDLSDGPLSEATWDRIKNDIVSFELVRVRKKT